MQIHRTGTFGRWYRTEVAIILPSLGRGASALGRCRVRDRPHVRTTRISHVVTDSTRRTNIEYSIRTNGEALGKGCWAVRRRASDARRWVLWVGRKPCT